MMKLGKIKLEPFQEEVVRKLKVGQVLKGGVGTGKTFTSLFWWKHNYKDMNLVIITTAAVRDKKSWQESIEALGEPVDDISTGYSENHRIVVDSWNNIQKYKKFKDTVFIFDEQRTVGYGAWTKAFIAIARAGNPWVLLSATPSDRWLDLVGVFIANGFFKHKTDFVRQHVIQDPYKPYFSIKAYMNEAKLEELRDSIIIPMDIKRHTTRHREEIVCEYDKKLYVSTATNYWNPFEDDIIDTASEMSSCLRKIVNMDVTRRIALKRLLLEHPKAIIFYNYTYELNLIRDICESINRPYSEWNGEKHEPIKDDKEQWAYIVQYTAGAEGWNCTSTDTIIFYSRNYAYRVMEQAEGRIDRFNTPYKDLYYYTLTSTSGIDTRIRQLVKQKKRFSEKDFFNSLKKY